MHGIFCPFSVINVLSRPTYSIVILLWRKFICAKSGSGMLKNPPIVFTFTRQKWSSISFCSYLVLLVWRSNIRITSHPCYFFHLATVSVFIVFTVVLYVSDPRACSVFTALYLFSQCLIFIISSLYTHLITYPAHWTMLYDILGFTGCTTNFNSERHIIYNNNFSRRS
jgi:hypothetical protein